VRRRKKQREKMEGLDSLRSSSAPAPSLGNTHQRPKPRSAYKGRKAASLPDLDGDNSIDFPDVNTLLSPTAIPAFTNPKPASPPFEAKTRPTPKGKGKVIPRRSTRLTHARVSTHLETSASDDSDIEIINSVSPHQSASGKRGINGKGKGRAIVVDVTDDEGEQTPLQYFDILLLNRGLSCVSQYRTSNTQTISVSII